MVKRLVVCMAFLAAAPGESRAETPAEIRQNVAVVRPIFHEKTRQVFAAMSERYRKEAQQIRAKSSVDTRLQTEDIQRFAQLLDQLSAQYLAFTGTPSHGTGWVWRPKRGKAFVITNKHVAGQAEETLVEFSGQKKRPLNGRVIYVSSRTDLAVIAVDAKKLPATADGLRLRERPFAEGDPVFASGFPGTMTAAGQTASYSLTDGIISNSEFTTGFDDGLTIEHTATIDPGNSGGPLLSRDKRGRFQVVGMNTAYNRGRRNSNLAIPCSLLRSELDAAMDSLAVRDSPNRMEQELIRAAKQLAVELGSASPKQSVVSGMIAYAYVGESPGSLLLPVEMWLKGELASEEFERAMRNPVEYARLLLFAQLDRAFGSDASNVGTVSLKQISDPDNVPSGGRVRSIFNVHGRNREITWIWEHGAWRIAHASIPSPKKAPR